MLRLRLALSASKNDSRPLWNPETQKHEVRRLAIRGAKQGVDQGPNNRVTGQHTLGFGAYCLMPNYVHLSAVTISAADGLRRAIGEVHLLTKAGEWAR
jgi:hypothetical protein